MHPKRQGMKNTALPLVRKLWRFTPRLLASLDSTPAGRDHDGSLPKSLCPPSASMDVTSFKMHEIWHLASSTSRPLSHHLWCAQPKTQESYQLSFSPLVSRATTNNHENRRQCRLPKNELNVPHALCISRCVAIPAVLLTILYDLFQLYLAPGHACRYITAVSATLRVPLEQAILRPSLKY
ncbi:uncharacterized protein IWZ02DRAFT_268411 [Phyllosticta citriasiana]|uniref:uncharacterized protein n=1 Tax=Phyllosticta citriasiana TaxID=595635 RepID=UPI0030FD699F